MKYQYYSKLLNSVITAINTSSATEFVSGTLFLHKETHITVIQGYLLENLFIFRLPANMCLGIFVKIFLSASPEKKNHIRSAHKFSYPLSNVIHGPPRERFSFNQSNRSPRLTCFTHTIEASLNNLRKFLRFFLFLKATTVGNESSVSGAKNPSPVIFVTIDL